MKIAHIVCIFPPAGGGIGTAASQFARLNAQAGHQVEVFTPLNKNNKKFPPDAGQGPKIKIHWLKPFLSLGRGAVLPQLFWQLPKFDLIILHYPFFGTTEIVYLSLIQRNLSQKKSRPRLIVYYHMDTAGLAPAFKLLSYPSKIILPALIKRAAVVVGSSFDYLAQSNIAGLFKRYQGKFRQLPFAVDTNVFCPGRQPQRPPITILFVGVLDRAHYFKGLDVLLRAARQLPGNLPAWRLVIVGAGDLQPHYQRLARQLGLGEKVEFLGALPFKQLTKVYAQADIFVLPSTDKSEAFGIVLLEALASGLPVIASRLAGVRQVFVEGQQGFFFTPGNDRELSQKIAVLLADQDLRRRFGRQARRHAEKHYSLEVVGGQLEEIISRAV